MTVSDSEHDREYKEMEDLLKQRDHEARQPDSVSDVITQLGHVRRVFARNRIKFEKRLLESKSPESGEGKPSLKSEAVEIYHRLFLQLQSLQKAFQRAADRRMQIQSRVAHELPLKVFEERQDTPVTSEHEEDKEDPHELDWGGRSGPDSGSESEKSPW